MNTFDRSGSIWIWLRIQPFLYLRRHIEVDLALILLSFNGIFNLNLKRLSYCWQLGSKLEQLEICIGSALAKL